MVEELLQLRTVNISKSLAPTILWRSDLNIIDICWDNSLVNGEMNI